MAHPRDKQLVRYNPVSDLQPHLLGLSPLDSAYYQ
jgi:hypothetical protein